jgi:hypothetical protein
LKEEAIYTCFVVGDDLQKAHLSWKVAGVPQTHSVKEESLKQLVNGSQSMSSHLTLTRSMWNKGTPVYCTLTHPSLVSHKVLTALKEQGETTLRWGTGLPSAPQTPTSPQDYPVSSPPPLPPWPPGLPQCPDQHCSQNNVRTAVSQATSFSHDPSSPSVISFFSCRFQGSQQPLHQPSQHVGPCREG